MSRDRSARRRTGWLCSLAVLVACAACGGGSSASTPPVTAEPAAPAVAKVAGLQPSESAQMVCAAEGQKDIAATVGVVPKHRIVGHWSKQIYSCNYVYSGTQTMALSVKELRNAPETGAYFDALGARLGRMHALQGLGQGAYQTTNGSTVVRKDNLVLLVDVTGLPAQFGVPSSPKADVSLSVAATIMGCWTGE
jgi:hypothetical protein